GLDGPRPAVRGPLEPRPRPRNPPADPARPALPPRRPLRPPRVLGSAWVPHRRGARRAPGRRDVVDGVAESSNQALGVPTGHHFPRPRAQGVAPRAVAQHPPPGRRPRAPPPP